MFTGIVQTTARVQAAEPKTFGIHLRLDCGDWRAQRSLSRPIATGDSIAVSGVCLTVAVIEGPSQNSGAVLGFDVVAQTLSWTTLGQLKPRDRVNIEPAVTPNQPMGGHFVQGHVDGLGRVIQVNDDPEDYRLKIQSPSQTADYLIPKGSIALEGVSLTVAAVDEAGFEVALVPSTLAMTTLGQCQVGDAVNLEMDMVVKSVFHAVRRIGGQEQSSGGAGRINMRMLRQAGFVEA